MTKTITFTSPKGGTGTSTVAAIVALTSGVKTLIVDQSSSRDLASVLAVHGTGPIVEVTENLDLAVGDDWETDGYELVVIDRGTNAYAVPGAENHLVVRRCYLSLKKATDYKGFDSLVVVSEEGRALTDNDCAAVLNIPVAARFAHDVAVSRAVDAGMIAHRANDFAHAGIRSLAKVPVA